MRPAHPMSSCHTPDNSMPCLRSCVYALIALILPSLAQGEALQVGDVAPNWILMGNNGETMSLYEEAERGHATVMIFCASWCENCKKLLPEIDALNVKHNSLGSPVSFYMMNVWEDGDPIAFVEARAPSLPLVLRADHVAKRYAVDVTPGVVVVGPDRRISYIRSRGADSTSVANQLQRLLASPD